MEINTVVAENARRLREEKRLTLDEAARLHHRLYPLHQAMFLESNPIPVKTALALMGRMSDEMRLPLCPLSADHLEALKAALHAQDLI